MSDLTPFEVGQVTALRSEGYSFREIAARIRAPAGIAYSAVARCVKRRLEEPTWAGLPRPHALLGVGICGEPGATFDVFVPVSLTRKGVVACILEIVRNHTSFRAAVGTCGFHDMFSQNNES